MNPLSDKTEKDSSTDFQEAYSIAKEALGFVGKFRTPPTPHVYEVWYRFVEGINEDLVRRVDYLVKEAKSAEETQLQELYQQFFGSEQPSKINEEASRILVTEIGGLQAIIRRQLNAGAEFGASVSSASESLLAEKVTAEEVKACISTVLSSNQQMQKQVEEMKSQLRDSQAQIDRLRENFYESQQRLLTDQLTGVGNRHLFDTLMHQSINHPDRNKTHLFLLLIDLDHFKLINDTLGHAAGDSVLRFVSSETKKMLPENASVARYGGDEFAIFLNSVHPNEGFELAESLCVFFAKNKFTLSTTGESIGQLTTSVGVAMLRPEDNRDSWFERADKLLYSAKQSGRNRVMAERIRN